MYTATFPVHIKFRIKRKAVPSCLQPLLPLSVLPFLSSAPALNRDQMSLQLSTRDSFCCQMSNLSGLPADVFF